ncbi:MAG: TonB-dependent receptor [Cytophagales bacterium CG12_big_fil_rev_8_21_14_0_65_40_12]|nr:MAG: TonB-dependent receptor [Cytophagales bacterium CG12_big_fil_rev_8_21_14_0_65_40_12]PIW02870.1 MAG: TonB-dependent receptor [Cytophagales bacterium CG17_big_fil_post_rev_8_21_14_2_50_40_13]
MKIYFITCFCLFLGFQVSAQVITIKDKNTDEPLELATVTSSTGKLFVLTNIKGQADISAFIDTEIIEIRMLGYGKLITSYSLLSENGFEVLLLPSKFSLDDVVVSATRWNQNKQDIPNKITTIAPRDIQLQNPQTAADLLGNSGEVFIQKSQQGGGSPMIRGFSTNRLLIAVDGVRMNTAIFRSGNLQNVISLDPFATESAEILFGPGSVIYGSDAIGGVMSFQTLSPQLSLTDESLVKGTALARYSSVNNEKTTHFDINVGWKKWALVTSFSNFNYGDLRMGSNGPDDYLRPFYVERQNGADVVIANPDPLVQHPTGYEQTNLMQKVRFKPNANWDLTYGLHYSATSNYSRYDRLIRMRGRLPRSAEWEYGPQIWLMNNLTASHLGKGNLYDKMTVRLAHQFFEESRIDRDFNDSERRSRIEKVNAYSSNLDFEKGLKGSSKLYYGVEAVYNDVDSRGTDEDISTGEIVEGPARYPQSSWASYAFYSSIQHRVSPKMLVQAGARYNYFVLDATFDTRFYPFPFETANISNGALTGSLGFVFNPEKDLTISTNISTGFRAPNIDDAGKVFDSEPGAVVVPNPNLGPEYAYNAEIGIAKVFNSILRVDITGFYTRLENALVRRDFTINGATEIDYDGELSRVQAIQNAAYATVSGIQAGFEFKFDSGFGFASRFNYQHGEEEVDDGTVSPSRHAAPWFGVTRLSYNDQNLRLEFYGMYSGQVTFAQLPLEEQGKDYLYAVDSQGNPYSPAWYTLNFKALYKVYNGLSISGGVENITDQRYRPYSSGIVAGGRNIILSLRVDF